MELKPGYKLTEVGVIPEDWGATKIGKIATKVGSGITPTGGNRVYKQEGRPFLRSQNVGWGCLFLDDIAFIDEVTHSTFAETEIKIGDVFLNITGASIGRSSVADCRVEGGNVNQHVCIIRTDECLLVPRFLNFILLSSLGQKQIDSFQAGGNRQGLNFSQVRSISIPLPPLPEQRLIATALSDMDELLGACDRLIAKKRDLKQAAMQQLLTGKTRLPGFGAGNGYKQTEIGTIPEDWEVKKLASVVNYKNGAAHEQRIHDSGKFVVVNSKFISTESLTCKYSDDCFCPAAKDDVLMVMSDVPNGKAIAKCFWVETNNLYTVNQRICVLSPRNINGKLLFYKLDRNPFYLQFDDGVKQTNLRKSEVLSCPLGLPKSETEQIAIATVLSDMDAEITALEQRRDKTRALKQAMMQELLTGKTRLVSPGEVYA